MQALLRILIRRSAGALCETDSQLVRQSIRPDDHRPLCNAATDLTRSRSELIPENTFLRQQLIVLQPQAKRPSLTYSDRTMVVLLASKLRSQQRLRFLPSEGRPLAALCYGVPSGSSL